MQKIILLGKKGDTNTDEKLKSLSPNSIIFTESFDESLRCLTGEDAEILLISRDFQDFKPQELLRIKGMGFHPFCIIWPPDDLFQSIITSFLFSDIEPVIKEPENGINMPSNEILIRKNQELSERITTMEAAIRSLLTALSHYDLAYEAYTGEDAWQLIMGGLPAVDKIPDEYLDEEDTDNDEVFDGTDGN